MFGFSLAEILVVLIIAVVCIRPSDWPEIANFIGRTLFKAKRMYSEIKNSFIELEKDSTVTDLKNEFNRGMVSEKLKDDKNSSIIVDIYGNEHIVSDLNELRSDLNKEEISREVSSLNKSNLEKNGFLYEDTDCKVTENLKS